MDWRLCRFSYAHAELRLSLVCRIIGRHFSQAGQHVPYRTL